MQDQQLTETEAKLRTAADWRPPTEMPLGLERRALASQRRPPLRPIGITRPRTVLLTTALAGALCLTVVVRLEKPTVAPSPVTQQTLAPVAESLLPDQKTDVQQPKTHRQNKETLMHLEQTPMQKQKMPKRFEDLPKRLGQSPKQKPQLERRKQDTPLTHRFPVAVDSPTDSVKTGNRVAIEAPAFTPAYYAQTSEDGESVTYTPVAMPLDDPDVITSEARPID